MKKPPKSIAGMIEAGAKALAVIKEGVTAETR